KAAIEREDVKVLVVAEILERELADAPVLELDPHAPAPEPLAVMEAGDLVLGDSLLGPDLLDELVLGVVPAGDRDLEHDLTGQLRVVGHPPADGVDGRGETPHGDPPLELLDQSHAPDHRDVEVLAGLRRQDLLATARQEDV